MPSLPFVIRSGLRKAAGFVLEHRLHIDGKTGLVCMQHQDMKQNLEAALDRALESGMSHLCNGFRDM